MHRGYVPVWRKLKDSTFYRDSEAVHLWIHLLFEAQHSNKKEIYKGEEIIINTGQFTTGRKRLSSETGISESKIQRLLNKFEKCHMIEQQTTSVNRLISITNYESYQVGEQQTNSKRTTSEQQVNSERTHSNNYIIKELKNKDIKESQIPINNYQKWTDIEFWEELLKANTPQQYEQSMIEKFYTYWAEPNNNGKMKFQMQKTWSIKGRLSTWSNNQFK